MLVLIGIQDPMMKINILLFTEINLTEYAKCVTRIYRQKLAVNGG
jgi:hypothetical protein